MSDIRDDVSIAEQENEVARILKEQAGIEVASLYCVKNLPDDEYMAALALLDLVMETDIPKDVRFVTKLCFSNSRARPYYRRIFRWWMESKGDTEPPNLEYALWRTYTKAECKWTWEQLSILPTSLWPFILVPRLWKHCVPKDEVRRLLLDLLNNGERAGWKLIEITKIDDPVLRAWFLDCGDLPRVVSRRVKRWRDPKDGQVRQAVAESPPPGKYREVFSADLDETTAEGEVASLSDSLGWSNVGPLIDLDYVPHRRFVVVWKGVEGEVRRSILAMREDETTLIFVWLEEEA